MDSRLDPAICYRAMQTRDRRFDGHFFIGVRSTGIYCRPVCPAPTPKAENCTFYRSAAAAQQAGHRPCLRCRPELSPQLWPAIDGASIVPRALRLIGAGALDSTSVTSLAAQLGVSDRYLRRRFAEVLGTSPTQVAKTRRILFAKQLITETMLTMTEIAIAAGFKSIRSFNYAIQQIYGCAPSQLRRHQGSSAPVGPITLKLSFSPPYNWAALAAFFQCSVDARVDVNHPLQVSPQHRIGRMSGMGFRWSLSLARATYAPRLAFLKLSYCRKLLIGCKECLTSTPMEQPSMISCSKIPYFTIAFNPG